MSENHGFKNEGALPVSEIFYSKGENELEGALQKDNVQAEVYIGSLNSRLKAEFSNIISNKKASLEAVEDHIDTAKAYIQEVTHTGQVHGDPHKRLLKVIKVLKKELQKLEEKADLMAKKQGVVREERVPEEAEGVAHEEEKVEETEEAPEVASAETEAAVLPAKENEGQPQEGGDTIEGLVDLATPIATAAVVGSTDVDPAIIGAVVDPEPVEDVNEKGRGAIKAIRDNAQKNKPKVEEKEIEAEVVDDEEESKESKKGIKMENLEDLSAFLKELPTNKDLTKEEGEEVFKDIVAVLQQASHNAKASGKEGVEILIDLVEVFKDSLVSGDIHETVVTNLMQDLGKEFSALTRVLNHALKRMIRAKEKISNHIAKDKLKDLDIDHNDGIAMFKELTESLNKEFEQAEAKGVDALESYLKELQDLNTKVQSSLASETDANKQKLTQRFADQLTKRIEQTTILIKKKKEEAEKPEPAPAPTPAKDPTPAPEKDKDTDPAPTPEPEPTPAPEPVPAPTADPIPTPDVEAPKTKRDIEDIVDFGDITNPTQASEAIKNDEGFNVWINTINERGYDGEIRTIEDWHKEYTEQKVSIDKIKEIFKKSDIEKTMFEGFKTKEEKEKAKKIHIEKLELSFLTDTFAKEKIEKIIASHEATKVQAEKIKKLEDERARLEKEYKGKKLKMSEEVVFKALYGEEAEKVKVDYLLGFLTDMEHNYKHYRGSLDKEGTPNELSEMFGLYNLSRKHPTDDKEGKISWGKRLFAKVRHQLFDTDNDYDYRKEFKEKIQVLRDAGIVETKNVDEDTAHDNLFRLKRLAEEIAEGVENGLTIEEALAESEEEPSKALFNKVFPKFIEAIANNDKLQSGAKEKARSTNLFEEIDKKIAAEKAEAIDLEKLFTAEAVGTQTEREEFATMVRQELTGQKLDVLVEKLGAKKVDVKTLEQLAIQFADLKEEDAESSLYKRVTMLLYTEEIRLSANIKEINIAPNSIKKWNAIFENEDVSKEDKTKYIDNMLKLLNEKFAKLTLPKNTVERVGVKGFIKYFEDKKSQFK